MGFTIFLLLFLLFAGVVLFVVVSAFLGFLLTRVPFVRTSAQDLKFIAKRVPISPSHVFYDLGSGDGQVCFFVNRLTGAKCVGFELAWWTYALALLKLRLKNRNLKIEFKNKNFFKVNWREANYIYAYLYPPLMRRVEEKFLADCKPGAVAVIRDFPFPNIKPAEVLIRPKNHEIYLYRHP